MSIPLTFLLDSSSINDFKINGDNILDNTIDGKKIMNGTIDNLKFIVDNINGNKILDNSISGAKLLNGSIDSTKITDNSISGQKILNGSIDDSKILNGSIDNIKLINNNINGNKILDNTINGLKLLNNSIDDSKIIINSINGNKLIDNTINNNKLMDGTIENSKIKDTTIDNSKLINNNINGNKILNNTISNNKLVDGTIENSKIKDYTIDNIKLIDNNINGEKLKDKTIDINKIINPDNISKILHGNGTWKVLDTIYNDIIMTDTNFNINYSNNELNIFNINYNYDIGSFNLSNLNNKFNILVSSPDSNIFNITFNSNTHQYLKFSEDIDTNNKSINFYSDYFSLSNKSIVLNNSNSPGGLEGLIIYDNNNQGYIRRSSDLSKYEFKLPSMNTNIYLKPHINQDTLVIIDYDNQYLRQGYLYFDDAFGIDTYTTNKILNIGNNNASIINIGCSSIDNTINIGSNSGSSIINIGYIGDTVNIIGSLNYIQSTNLQIFNKIIQINEGATVNGTARYAGINIKDNNLDNAGYILTSNTGNYFILKAPENDFILSTPILTRDSNILLDQGDLYVNGTISSSSKIIKLNCDSNTDEIVLNAGLYFNKNGVYDSGYLRTSDTGNHFHFRPPNSTHIIQTPTLLIDSMMLVDNGNQIINGTFLMTNNNGIDTNGNGNENILNIGYNNSKVINIGNHIINSPYTINIGTGIGVGTINIGTNDDIVNINGRVNSQHSTNLHVSNKIIVLNDGSITAQSCRLAGINFSDNNVLNAGYILTGDLGNNYIFKAPENNYILSTPILTIDSQTLINQGNSSIINGDILFSDGKGIDTINIGSDILNIGYDKAHQINIGNYTKSHIINIGNSSNGSLTYNVVNICTDTNSSICNIGNNNNNDTNNIIGNNILSSLNVNNNYILLNKLNSSIYNSGLKINYNGNEEAGYIKTSSNGSYYNIKAPDNIFILSTPILTINSKILIDRGDTNINDGNILLSDGKGVDNINVNSVLNIGTINSKYIVIGSINSSVIQVKNNLEVNGSLTTTGDIISYGTMSTISDIKLKTNINTIENNIIYDLKPVQYNWITNDYFNKNGEYDVGFIAQDVEKIAPHLISKINDKDGNEYKTLGYDKIVPYLVDEIQNLNKRIKNYENIINEQNNKIDKLLKYLNI